MDEGLRCKIHKKRVKALCMSCNSLICHNCLSLHADKGCKYPIGLPVYAEQHLLPKIKAQLQELEEKKGEMQERLERFKNEFSSVRQGLENLKLKLTTLLNNINESIEKIDKDFGNLASPYENIKKMLLKSCKEIEYATVKEDMGCIIKKLNESKQIEVIEISESEKLLIDAVNESIATLLDLHVFDVLEEGLNELLTKSRSYFKQSDPQFANQNVYGICELQANCTKLCQYNIQSNKLVATITVPKWCTIVQIANRVFISGGHNPVTNTLYEFKENTKTLANRQPMKYVKYDHKAQNIFEIEFITVGGYNGTSSLSSCESYSIIQNKWNAVPSLNKPRYNTATALLNNRLLYAIGGCNTSGEIEVLDIIERNGWEILNLEVSSMMLNGSPGAFSISDKEIIILKDESKETGILNVSDRTLNNYKDGLKNDYYYCNPICDIGGKVYVIGATHGHLVVYDIDKKLFTVLNYSDICA